MGEEGGSYVQLMLAASLVIGAFLVVLTCTWKLVRLLAMYKMESQIEVGTYRILIEEDLFKDLFRDRRNTSPDFFFVGHYGEDIIRAHVHPRGGRCWPNYCTIKKLHIKIYLRGVKLSAPSIFRGQNIHWRLIKLRSTFFIFQPITAQLQDIGQI